MIERATSVANIQSMLQTMRALQAQAGGAEVQAPVAPAVHGLQGPQGPQGTGKAAFTDLVKGAISQVNDAQVASRNLQTAYERGENIPLTDVVLGMQKSSLAFEATLQIRNKVLKAYEEILNMPV
ncbi:MAG: Flagellar hook-basal body complex protein FliE [Pseudomonadota bacterium]|jgi:flagellar hook-basal body complex protein FliE